MSVSFFCECVHKELPLSLFSTFFCRDDSSSIGPTINPGDSAVLTEVVTSEEGKAKLAFDEYGTPGDYTPVGESSFSNPTFRFENEQPPKLDAAEPVYESLKSPTDYEQIGAELKSSGATRPVDEYQVMSAAPVKQVEKELRSFEDQVRPRAVENPYEVLPTVSTDDNNESSLL